MIKIWKKSLLAAIVLMIFSGNSFAEEKKELSFDEMMSNQVKENAPVVVKKETPKVQPPVLKRAVPKATVSKVPPARQPTPIEPEAPVLPPQAAKATPAQESTPKEPEAHLVASASKEEAPAPKIEVPVEVTPAQSATSIPAPTIPKWFEVVNVTGLVDAYYTYNGNGYRGMGDNQYLGFAPDSNEFSAALFELNFEKKPVAEHPTGFYVGLMAGTTPFLIDQAGDKTAFSGLLRQVYGSLLLAPNLQLDIGKYVTLMGAEVIESNTNWNYTRSLLFSYAEPVLHSGARLTYTVNDALYIQGHIINGWNNVINHTSGKGVCVQVGITPIKPLPIVLNYMTGSESVAANATGPLTNIGSRSLFDAVMIFNATDALSFMVNYDNGSQSNGTAAGASANWSGVAGYARYTGAMPFLSTIALRIESYNDTDGFTTGTKQTLNEGTITLEKAIDGALLRLDVRQDSSDQNVFTVSDGTTSQSQLTVTFGAVFTF